MAEAQVQAPVEGVATPAPETSEQTPKVDDNTKRYAHLSKQQKALRAEQVRVQNERMKLNAEREAFQQQLKDAQSAQEWKTRLSKKDFDVLKDAGITQDDLTQYLVNQPSATDKQIMMMQQKIEELQGGLTAAQKAQEEAAQKSYDQAVNQISSEVKMLVKGAGDKYELIGANNAYDAAVELIKEVFDTEGYVMTAEEACNEVEEYLLEESVKLMNLKKIQAKFAPPSPPEAKLPPPSMGKPSFSMQVREMVQKQAAPSKTLTHQQMPLSTSEKLSPKDRRARAIAAFQGKMNS